MFREAKIKSIKFCFPKKVYDNNHIKLEHPSYDINNFEKKVGIRRRYLTNDFETGLDLAEKACNDLLKDYPNLKLDFIIYCTQSPEYILPTTSCILQDRLNLSKNVGAIDYNLGCSGYIYGLKIANGLIKSGECDNVLLVTAETYSKFINKGDVVNKAIFGDAASATLITKSSEKGILKSITKTDGSGFDKLIIKNGGSKNKIISNPIRKTYSNCVYTDNDLYMNGPDIFNFTIKNIPNLCKEVLQFNNFEKTDIDYVIFHQANKFMLNFLRKKINFSEDKFCIDLEDGGNTVSNTIPIALSRAIKSGKVKKNNIILLVGFGVGLSYGGIIIKL